MNARQSFALNDPVIDPQDDVAALEKFATIVTVDQHKGEFYWHVSVSLLNSDGKPLPIKHLSSIEKVVALGLARKLLDDVGRPDNEDAHEDEKSIHIVRHVTIEEEREARKAIARTTASGPARCSKRLS